MLTLNIDPASDRLHINASPDEVLALLEEVVAEYGEDYVYPGHNTTGGCVYTKDGAPSCLVGHALTRLGVPVDFLSEHNDFAVSNIQRLTMDEEVLDMLQTAQETQDIGCTWGHALEDARLVIYPEDTEHLL